MPLDPGQRTSPAAGTWSRMVRKSNFAFCVRVSFSASKAFCSPWKYPRELSVGVYLRCGCAWCSSSKVIAPATRFHHLARRRFGRRRRSSLSWPRSSGDGDRDRDGCVACRYVGAGFGSVAAYAGRGEGHAPQGHAAGRGWSRTYRFMAARVTAIFVSTLFMGKTSPTGVSLRFWHC